jgi:hypothetical protein
MKTEITQKLAAVVIAMSMNALILGTVAYLFDGKVHAHTVASMQSAPTIVASARI